MSRNGQVPGERWVYADLIGAASLAFLTSDPVVAGAVLEARRLTIIRLDLVRGRVGIEKCPGYEAGILADPVFIPVDSCSLLCLAPKRMVESAEEAWSTIQRPDPGQVRDLGKG
jgi:hypothetical protein